MDLRVEISCPIYDEEIKQEILETFDISWNDNVKARIHSLDQDNAYRRNDKGPLRSQFALYEYYQKKLENYKV